MYYFYSIISALAIMGVEYLYRSDTAFIYWYYLIPLVLLGQFGLYGVFTSAPTYFGGLIVFSSANFLLRFFVSLALLKEPFSLKLTLGLVGILIINFFIR